MSLSAKAGGAWKNVANVSAKAGGAWKNATKVYVKVAGVWKEAWASILTFYNSVKSGTNSTFTKYSTYVELYAYDPVSGGGEVRLCSTSAVDLTGKTSLQVDWDKSSSSTIQQDAILSICPESSGPNGAWSQLINFGSNFSRRTDTMTLSGLTGKYYIRVHSAINGGVINWTRVNVYRILLNGVVIWDGSNPSQTV